MSSLHNIDDDTDECKHGMNPEWCGPCKGMRSVEEQAELEDAAANVAFDKLLDRWSRPGYK